MNQKFQENNAIIIKKKFTTRIKHYVLMHITTYRTIKRDIVFISVLHPPRNGIQI